MSDSLNRFNCVKYMYYWDMFRLDYQTIEIKPLHMYIRYFTLASSLMNLNKDNLEKFQINGKWTNLSSGLKRILYLSIQICMSLKTDKFIGICLLQINLLLRNMKVNPANWIKKKPYKRYFVICLYLEINDSCK